MDIKFDCLIMDVFLPDIKVYRAIPIVQSIDSNIKIIITSAINSVNLELKIRDKQIFYYYIKSYDLEELSMAVQNAFKFMLSEGGEGSGQVSKNSHHR